MNNDAKETIRAKLPIESVVGSYVKLEKAGKNFRAPCPFHHEKTPSFYVTPDRGIYYCYGCHKGGDIFRFVEEIEGVSFLDALKSLADKAGVSLDAAHGERSSKVSVLREIMETATKFYEVGLRTNKPVVDYLMSRGMTKDTMIEFRVGYAQKGWSNLYDLLKKKYKDEDILATGLCLTGQRGGLYDRFRERIMFPICDGQGRVIAFSGRVMPGTEEAEKPVGKYINSPETDLYHKSSVLFAYDKAKTHIHADGFVIIVEGQMDCLMSHQAGVKNVVALSGTASTDQHMQQLERFTNNVAICLDADKAGLAAAQKTAMVAYAHGMKVLVIDVPSAKDPADLIAENAESWKGIVSHRKDFITFRLEKMKQNGQEAEKVSIAEKELFPVMAHIQSQIVLDDKLQEIAHAFGTSAAEPIRIEFEKFMKREGAAIKADASRVEAPASVRHDPKAGLRNGMIGILALMNGIPEAREPHETYARIAPDVPFDSIGEQERNQLAFQAEQSLGTLPEALSLILRSFHDCAMRYELLSLEEEKARLDRELVSDPHNAELLTKIHELLRRKDALIHQVTNH